MLGQDIRLRDPESPFAVVSSFATILHPVTASQTSGQHVVLTPARIDFTLYVMPETRPRSLALQCYTFKCASLFNGGSLYPLWSHSPSHPVPLFHAISSLNRCRISLQLSELDRSRSVDNRSFIKERACRCVLRPPAETSAFALMFLSPLYIPFVSSLRLHDLRRCSLRRCKKCKHEVFITDPDFRRFCFACAFDFMREIQQLRGLGWMD